jgi:hypothetical protein
MNREETGMKHCSTIGTMADAIQHEQEKPPLHKILCKGSRISADEPPGNTELDKKGIGILHIGE